MNKEKPDPEVQALIDALVECRHWVAYLDDVHGTNIITKSAIKMADDALAPFRPTIWERRP